MAISAAPEAVLSRVAARIAEAMGLHFPQERWNDLERGVARAAGELGFPDSAACLEWLASGAPSKGQWQVIAGELTVGETYFFREQKTFDVLASSILPELIRERQGGERRLRIWSAGCCTGEEAYSLAILLSQVVPYLDDWNVTILATDINERFLKKAAAGVYGEWSFRNAPPGLKETYFQRAPDGRYAVVPAIKRRVTFVQLNLVEDVFPSLDTDTNAMDIIFCRNVLMYFAQPQLRKVVGNLRRALVDGGWLIVSPSEVSQPLFPGFKPMNFPDVILYRKSNEPDRPLPSWAPPVMPEIPRYFAPLVETPAVPVPQAPPMPAPADTIENAQSPSTEAVRLYEDGRYGDVVDLLIHGPVAPAEAAAFSLVARALANLGQLREALEWCDRWLAADKLDASGHYLRAVIQQELGDLAGARQSLGRAVYLRPEMVLAHFALGNLARSAGTMPEARRHFANALRFLRAHPSDEPLAESEGLTAGRLSEIITSLAAIESEP